MIFQYIRFPSLILISLIVLAGCGGSAPATSAPATSAPEATPTSEPATPTPEPPTPTPEPEGTPTPVIEEVTFEFAKELSTLEELEDIGFSLDEVEGIDGSSGSEVSITIRYDPEVITVDEIRATMAQIGYAVKE